MLSLVATVGQKNKAKSQLPDVAHNLPELFFPVKASCMTTLEVFGALVFITSLPKRK